MMIKSYTVQQVSRYTPVADELQTMLNIIQEEWKCKIISVHETKVNDIPNVSNQAFIIIYEQEGDDD